MANNAARKSYTHREILRWLWLVSCGLRLQSVLNAIISILLVGLDFAFISATKWAVDIATGKSEEELRWAAAMLIAVVVARLIIGFSNRWIVAILGVRSQNKLQTRTFDILMQSEWRGLEERHTGDTLNRLEHDVRDITNTITDVIPSTLAVGIRLVGAFLFLYSMDRTLPFLLICISPAFVLLSKVYVNRMRALAHTIRATDSQIQSLLQESLQHRMVLKTLEQCHTMVRKLETLQQQLRQQVRHRTRFSSISALLLNMGFSTGYLVAFLWGVARLQEGSITYGVLLAFIQLVGQIQTPFREMSRYIPHLVSSLTACERLMELEATPQEETGEPLVLQQESGIRLRDVSFAYDQHHRTILQHLDYDFPPGSFTAIQGETGAGKTTLIRLILALMRPTQGCVELYNAKECHTASALTRANIVYVPQGNSLLSGTIRQNLLLGNPQATESQMREALHTACADFVLESPDGLDTRCGEQGTGLSEGQSQRIAIARALLRNGQILLLDEATSALDTDTETQLLQRLAARTTGKQTIICITHRPAVLQYCTQTMRLQRIDSETTNSIK